MSVTAAETTQVAMDPVANLAVSGVFIAVTLVLIIWASKRSKTSTGFYAGDRSFGAAQNGLAITGDFVSAAAFLGIAGAMAVNGYDGFIYAIGFFAGWLLTMLLIAERLRNIGKYTLGDVLSFRMNQRPVRVAAATSSLVITYLYLVAQMAGVGTLAAVLLGVRSQVGQAIAIAIVGGLMLLYVVVGGMRGTTLTQIIKAAMMMSVGIILAVWVLALFGFNLSALLGAAADNSPHGDALLAPGLAYGVSSLTQIDFLSLSLALVLGSIGLPHILMRYYTVPTAKVARKSVAWAIWLIGIFSILSLVIGYGAVAKVGGDTIAAAPGGANSAALLLAFDLGGVPFLAIVSAVALATVLAVVAGLTITAAAAFGHDIYANVIRAGKPTDDRTEVRAGKVGAIIIGVLAIFGGILATGQNIAFLVALGYVVAASANLPTMLYTLFWKRFNTAGSLWAIYGGLTTSVVLIVFSPTVSGLPTSMIPGVDFHWFPLKNPGLISIPAGFLFGFLGTVLSKDRGESARFVEQEVRGLTGIGAAKATDH